MHAEVAYLFRHVLLRDAKDRVFEANTLGLLSDIAWANGQFALCHELLQEAARIYGAANLHKMKDRCLADMRRCVSAVSDAV